MPKHFNTAGPVNTDDHYTVPPLYRLDWPEINSLIEDKKYFVLHAPRQTGKTSTLLAMMDTLNASGEYAALYANIEAAQANRGDVATGLRAITTQIAEQAALYLGDKRLRAWAQEALTDNGPSTALTALLARWAAETPKPIILMLDEVDALVGDTLISLLRQIRAGYAQRPGAFPQSIILCGVRDVRDYRIHTGNNEIITGGSAFNIKAKSLRMGNFTAEDVENLLTQHTTETGQIFEAAILPRIWQDTAGQPWLVNALAHEMVWEDRAARDRSTLITLERYRAARERLIYSRATHLDQLTDKLREPRVRAIIAALLSGEDIVQQFPVDDLQYLEDLGLLTLRPEIRISNDIYREVIPREITWPIQTVLHFPQPWYVMPDRRLDIPKLLAAFQQFFREHSEAWLQTFDFHEAGPQLLMQAFLQRIVNGGGRVNREYGLGRKRTDVFLEWPIDEAQGYFGPVQRVVIELKILHKGLEKTVQDGLAQTADYADRCGADEAHLIIFNRDATVSWDDKIWQRNEQFQNLCIGVWGA